MADDVGANLIKTGCACTCLPFAVAFVVFMVLFLFELVKQMA